MASVAKAPSASPLPSYLARHVQLGFDADDITALLTSIESSQGLETSSLSHLPAEIICRIIERVPIDYVLGLRLVSRGIKEYIDTFVKYSYLERSQLSCPTLPWAPAAGHAFARGFNFSQDDYEELYLLRAYFSHVEAPITAVDESCAKWAGDIAVFKMEDRWFKAVQRLGSSVPPFLTPILDWDTLPISVPRQDSETHGKMRWLFHLDHSVLDSGFQAPRPHLQISQNIEERSLRVNWRDLIQWSLSTETRLRRMMDEAQSAFTFSPQEDRLRALRRSCLRDTITLFREEDQGRVRWALNALPPLFGKPRFDRPSAAWDSLEHFENDAAALVTILRREAALNPQEHAHLQQLAKDRELMVTELSRAVDLFAAWRSGMYSQEGEPTSWTKVKKPISSPPFAILPKNPMAWTDAQRRVEEQRICKWKSQKKMREQLTRLLTDSQDEMYMMDNGLTDLESDI
ncbi:hypothetical protein K491DRAFT_719122 [Lophiostoma macrostomum CBS 122681]|uniref:F-box domain-containing protein n=1 Tax=Lophiostoma macrostomum CBS 122681 TaxID=1314788 RepID=A0A6A6SYT0_9PLEO|nr:hypothetical protein K491DRAFT_719122 [Lophiostoma macrostomum CBS 122681]